MSEEKKKMQVVKVKDQYFLLHPNDEVPEINFKYFIRGKGWKKTKKFKVIETDLPQLWDENTTWFKVAKIGDEWGIEVAESYAECKTAGIVARQTAMGKMEMYNRIKDHLPENFNPDFFELLRCNYKSACFGLYTFDIVSFDGILEETVKDYNVREATYKGKPASCRDVVRGEYGQEYVDLINLLLDKVILNT